MKLATFTVQLELGPETRALLDRLAGGASIHIELGPSTRGLIERVFADRPDAASGAKPTLARLYGRLQR